jgi:hypothetical protein
MATVLRDMIKNIPHGITTVSNELQGIVEVLYPFIKVFCHHQFGRTGENFKYTTLLKVVCGVRF